MKKVLAKNPLKKKTKFDSVTYNRNYNKNNQFRKQMYFNKNIPEDMELYSWASRHKNFTKYIKSLIRKDMESHSELPDQLQMP